MERMLAELRQESETFVDVGLFDPRGTLVAYAGPHPQLLGKDYSRESWYRRLLSTRRGHVFSDVYLGFRDRPHFIVAISRVLDGEAWVLRASVDPEKFGDFVGSSYLFKDAEAFIVNQDGVRQTLSGQIDAEFVASQVPPRSPETVVSEVEVQGSRYVRALAWLTENDWALVVRVPVDRAYASLSHARLVLTGIMLTAMGFLLYVVFRSTRKIVGKLEKADTAKEDLRLHLFNAAKLASVGEMAAGVAHEINNPLAIIYEEASMMQDILDPQFGQEFKREDFQERLAAIKEATLRGRTITGKLMAFARRHDPDPEPSDINLLLERVLAVKDTEFKTSNIEVVRDHAEGLPQVMINRNQIDQVILNLLNNAKDAIDHDGRITTRTRLNGKSVRIEVQDTGSGMSPEVIERIFFPFFTTKGVGKGTGLGLSISYGIIESHGGRIQVKSKVGNGTIFTIWLPIEKTG